MVSRANFGLLLEHPRIDNFRGNVIYHGGYHPMTNAEMLLITLQYLGNQGAIRYLLISLTEQNLLFGMLCD
jgi:hypothetical protein